ncbi:MAG: hypothetical protein HY855_26620 [Burkholderiales bacterium]|nr:hypothetical protein [Burkholderiales bacterium]
MTRGQRALLIGLTAMLLAGLVDRVVRGSWLVLAVTLGLGVVLVVLPQAALWLASAARERLRERLWAPEQGHHHAFGGITLRIEHDAHHSWIAGSDLQRVLGTRDREDVLAARLAGQWRRDERGVLMLRVDGVVQHLATRPGRTDPRIQRLRRYLEREVLFPAAQRRARR